MRSINKTASIDHLPMTPMQVVIVALCVFLNAIDGFDVLAISFAAPGISEDWGINRAALGIVLSMELIGMSAGSVILGGLADKLGRRPVALGCLSAMALGMAGASFAANIIWLSIMRFITGIGIGGILAAGNSMAAEFSSLKRRALSVSLLGAGFPLGGILGGIVAAQLLETVNWRAIFLFGSVVTALFIPLVYFLIPETVSYQVKRRPANALEKVNDTLRRLGHAQVESLPPVQKSESKTGIKELFSSSLARTTVLLTVGYFTHILAYYYVLKWTPKIVADMGFTDSVAGGVLVWVSVGGAIGALVYGSLTQIFRGRRLLLGTLACAAVMIMVFGQTPQNLALITLMAFGAGFFGNAAMVGLYTLFVYHYPTRVRAGGTGFVIGVGRGGAALSPILAGFLFMADFSLALVSALIAVGSLISVLAIWCLPKPVEDA